MTTYRQLQQECSRRLEAAGIEHADCEAEVMLSDLLDISRAALGSVQTRNVPEEFLARLQPLLARRLAREPWQYILGHAPFRWLELEVTPAVLIPRPETEILVDLALQKLPSGGMLADIGTGSGAIALSIAYERSDARVAAVDASAAALDVARRNRERYKLDRVELFVGNLLEPLAAMPLDVIVANLPYVTEAEYAALAPEVKLHEPQLALTAPEQGLALIRRLIETTPDGVELLLEFGAEQGGAVRALLSSNGFTAIQLHRDLTGRTRFSSARR